MPQCPEARQAPYCFHSASSTGCWGLPDDEWEMGQAREQPGAQAPEIQPGGAARLCTSTLWAGLWAAPQALTLSQPSKDPFQASPSRWMFALQQACCTPAGLLKCLEDSTADLHRARQPGHRHAMQHGALTPACSQAVGPVDQT